MATSTFSTAQTNGTDAQFRDWVSKTIAGLVAAGLVRTTDTGQINEATVLAPTAAATKQGYAILRMNDSLQATAPIFIRLDFGSGGLAATPNLWVTVGKGSDGAGNITGVLLTETRMGHTGSTASAVSATASSCYASAGEGWCALVLFATGYSGTAPSALYLLIDRSRNGAGALTADGVAIAHGVSTSSASAVYQLAGTTAGYMRHRFEVFNYATGTKNEGIVPVVAPYRINGTVLGGSSALAAGGIGPIFPWTAIAPGLAPWQCSAGVSYPGGDAPGGAFSAVLQSTARTYLAIPLTDNCNGWGTALTSMDDSQTGTSKYIGLAIRWE